MLIPLTSHTAYMYWCSTNWASQAMVHTIKKFCLTPVFVCLCVGWVCYWAHPMDEHTILWQSTKARSVGQASTWPDPHSSWYNKFSKGRLKIVATCHACCTLSHWIKTISTLFFVFSFNIDCLLICFLLLLVPCKSLMTLVCEILIAEAKKVLHHNIEKEKPH